MMVGMNVINMVSTFHEQASIEQSIKFLLTHPIFVQDIIILCLSETIGQLFIYITIEKFGFIAFVLSLIGRQLVAALIWSFYPVTAIQVAFGVGCLSLLCALLSNNRRIKTE